MYIGISYDGRITSLSASPARHIGGNVYLSSYGEPILQIPDGSVYYNDDYDDSPYEKGKVRCVGDTYFSYYCDRSEDPDCVLGKVYRIGDTFLSYYKDRSEDPDCKLGKIYRIGDVFISYYDYDEDRPGQPYRVGDYYLN